MRQHDSLVTDSSKQSADLAHVVVVVVAVVVGVVVVVIVATAWTDVHIHVCTHVTDVIAHVYMQLSALRDGHGSYSTASTAALWAGPHIV